jgi:hypothetical protein
LLVGFFRPDVFFDFFLDQMLLVVVVE